jgi:hypothetical protein
MAEREFSEAQRKLEQTLTKLKETKDPKLRLLLLREMRRLLADADRILDSPQ